MDGAHYFSPDPDSPSRPARVRLTLPDLTVDLDTDTGVFSADRIDPGTRILLATAPEKISGAQELVDLGAGYGPIAVTLASRHPDARVWAVEPNRRARDLCRSTARRYGLDNVVTVAPDEVPDSLEVDGLWSNPPIRIGKSALHDMLAQWLVRLGGGAAAWLVVGRHLGADSLARWLEAEGWCTRRAASRQTYRVLEVTKRADADLD